MACSTASTPSIPTSSSSTCENPSRDVLEQMFQVSRIVRRPIAMFVDQSDRATIEKAIDAGVSAYIVDGLKRERVRAILDMTISRFGAFERLRVELEETKSALKERKVIEKAKGILMKSRGLDEEAAYALSAPYGHEQGQAHRRHRRKPAQAPSIYSELSKHDHRP